MIYENTYEKKNLLIAVFWFSSPNLHRFQK